MELINGTISVIIPAYNAEKFIQDVLDDLTEQLYQDMEIVVIDDGSTDKSAKKIQKIAQKDKRIQFIHTENGGPSKARNLALDIAKGEYIRFIDADDRIPQDSMSNLVNIYKDNSDIDLVIGNYLMDNGTGYFTGRELPNEKVDSKSFAEIFVDHMKSFYFGVPWNKLYKREIIEKYHIRFNEEIDWCEDFLFNVEYYSKCKEIYFLNLSQGVYHYCTHDTGITANVSKKRIEEFEYIETLRYEKMQEYCKQFGLLEEFELVWKYSELYERLSTITKYFRNDHIWTKFNKFKQCLNEEDAYLYICRKWNKTNFKVWYLLKEAIETNKYLKVFMYFIIKGIYNKHLCRLLPRAEKGVQEEENKK